MEIISRVTKDGLTAAAQLLNQPIVKEGVKNIAGAVTFAFGLIEIYDIYQIFRGRKISTEESTEQPKWAHTANKIEIVCAKASLVVSATVSRPGVFVISSLVGRIFSPAQRNRVFGLNTQFAVNPWHPRHVFSIAAVILAVPSVVRLTWQSIDWAYKTIRCRAPARERDAAAWLTDTKIRLMVLFNTLTSRPILHMGNQAVRLLLHPA